MKPNPNVVRDVGFAENAIRRAANELRNLGFDVSSVEANNGQMLGDSVVKAVGFTAETGRRQLRQTWRVYVGQELSERARPTLHLYLDNGVHGVKPYRFHMSAGGADDVVTAIHTQATAFNEFQELYSGLQDRGLHDPEPPVFEAAS